MIIQEMTITDFEKISKNLKTDFDDFWSESILKQEILNGDTFYIVAKDEQENILGFTGIRIILDEAELMNIVVRKDKRNQGIGRQLLEKIINIAKSKNLKNLKLEVSEKNVPAISLYKSKGFKLKGIRKNYYNNCENALLLDLIL